jgi:hypothetical protein
MERAGWVFTGSCLIDDYLPPDYKTSKKIYGARATGSIMVTYHDETAVLDTALYGSQSTYKAWSDRLPERFTPVVIHIRPWKDGDEKADPLEKNSARPPGGGAPSAPGPPTAPSGSGSK